MQLGAPVPGLLFEVRDQGSVPVQRSTSCFLFLFRASATSPASVAVREVRSWGLTMTHQTTQLRTCRVLGQGVEYMDTDDTSLIHCNSHAKIVVLDCREIVNGFSV